MAAVVIRPKPEPPAASRFYVAAPEKASFVPNYGPGVISPDGRRIVSVISSEGRSQLWVRALDSLAAQPLAGTDQGRNPFWSPDSRFIGFFADGKLKKIDVLGGPAQTLCDVTNAQGGSWNRDGVIIFTPGTNEALRRVSSAGGQATPLTKLDQGGQEISHRHPFFLPDDRHFLFFARSSQPEKSAIAVGSLDGQPLKRLLAADSSVAYAPAPDGGIGYVLFVRQGTLMAHPFDAAKLELRGEPFPVAEQVAFTTLNSLAAFSVSRNGTLVYMGGSGAAETSELIWLDRAGKRLSRAGEIGTYQDLNLSPDGSRVAVGRIDTQARNQDIWVLEFGRNVFSRFTFHPAVENAPLWSPDGKRIVFNSARDGPFNLYQKVSSGEGNEDALLRDASFKVPYDWSPDGRFILYSSREAQKPGRDLWVLPVSGDGKPAPAVQTQHDKFQAQFSPDGRWMAYVSDESGRPQVYVRPFPAAPGQFQVSTTGGIQPRWRRDGKELYYIAPDRKVMAVEVRTSPGFQPATPRALFQGPLIGLSILGFRYAVSRDGQRFLFNAQVEEAATSPLTVVLNWTAGKK